LKNEIFDEEIVIVEDLLLWIKIALKHPIFHLEKETVVYNLHDGNSINIHNKSAMKRLLGLKTFLKKRPDIRAQIAEKYWNTTIGDTHFSLMKYYILSNEKIKAVKHLLLSIYYQKRHPQLKHKLFVLGLLMLNRRVSEYS
jgi:hypothetical protein